MLLEDIGAYLQANGIGTVGTNILRGPLPTSPDNVVTLFEYPGEAPVHVKQRIGPVLEKPRFQVTVRDLNPDAARLKIERIYQLLSGYSGTINGINYARIQALQAPFWLMRDESRRTSFENNYQVWKQVSPTS